MLSKTVRTIATIIYPTPALVRAVRRVAGPPVARPSGPLLDFSVSRAGTVTADSVQWVPNTYSTGNLGYMSNSGLMYVPGVRTDQIHKREFWLNEKHSFTLVGHPEVALRPGHQVGVLCVGKQIAYLRNHDTRETYEIASLPALLPMPEPTGIVAIWAISLLVVPWAVVLLSAVAVALGGLVFLPFQADYNHSMVPPIICALGAIAFFVSPVVCLVRLFRRRAREKRANVERWEQGRAEMLEACRRGLGVVPADL